MIQHSLVAALPWCRWAPDLSSAAALALDGGSQWFAPIFNVQRGMYTNSTEYVAYPLTAGLLGSTGLTIVVECIPEFASDETTLRYVFNTTATNLCWLTRNAAAALSVGLCGTAIGTVAHATWGPYWRRNERNQFVIAAISGSTQLYLNGTLVATWATAYTPSATMTDIALGADTTGANFWQGWISHVAVLSQKWNAQEASDWWTGRTYRYRDEAQYLWPLLQRDVFVGGTTDRSAFKRNGANVNITKLAGRRGYSLGGWGHIVGGGLPVLNDFSVVAAINSTTIGNYSWCSSGDGGGPPVGQAAFEIHHRAAGDIWARVKDAAGQDLAIDVGSARWNVTQVVGLSRTDGTLRMYINGLAGATVASNRVLSAGYLALGAPYADISLSHVYYMGIWSRALTPTQQAIEHRRLMDGLLMV